MIYGTPGGALGDSATWAKNADTAKVGGIGEKKTADLVHDLCADDYATDVFHDVSIPGAHSANADHIFVSGSRIWIVDSKVWEPGRYWTLRGKSYRGKTHMPYLSSKTMGMARDRIELHLMSKGIKDFTILTPSLVVWSSRPGQKVSTSMLRVPDAEVIDPKTLRQRLTHKKWRDHGDERIADVIYALTR